MWFLAYLHASSIFLFVCFCFGGKDGMGRGVRALSFFCYEDPSLRTSSQDLFVVKSPKKLLFAILATN